MMIFRCPGCTDQIDEKAAMCPSCHWDFRAAVRIKDPIRPLIQPPKPRPVEPVAEANSRVSKAAALVVLILSGWCAATAIM